MAVIETKFSVGDVVYHARTTTEGKQHPCPDCKGEKRWKAVSPAGDEFTFACPRCSSSYSAWDDMSLKYTASVASVQCLTIGSVRYDSQSHSHRDDPQTSYMCNETGVGSGSIYREDRLFRTAEEAKQCADILAAHADKNSTWIANRYNKTLQISDYQISSAALKNAEDEKSRARSLLYNIGDLFATIEEADDRDAILEAVADYKRWHLERDLASAGEAGTAETVKQGAVHEHATAESGDAQTPSPSSRERK